MLFFCGCEWELYESYVTLKLKQTLKEIKLKLLIKVGYGVIAKHTPKISIVNNYMKHKKPHRKVQALRQVANRNCKSANDLDGAQKIDQCQEDKKSAHGMQSSDHKRG